MGTTEVRIHRMVRLWAATSIVVAGLLLTFTSVAAADEMQDAACVVPTTGGTSSGTPATGRMGETFTALNTGGLTRAQILIDKGPASTGDYVLDVRTADPFTDAPTENVLASTTILNSSVSAGTSTLIGTFSSPAPVVAGQRYALAVSRPGGNELSVRLNMTNPCSDGRFYTNTAAGAAWNSPSASYDAAFAVFVTPPAPPSPTSTTAAPTGQRAAALAHCRKKFRHDRAKRRRCKRKANQLPA